LFNHRSRMLLSRVIYTTHKLWEKLAQHFFFVFFYNSIDRPQREFRCSTLVLNHFDERIFQTIPELFPTQNKKFNASAGYTIASKSETIERLDFHMISESNHSSHFTL
jgi:hypothetical protein